MFKGFGEQVTPGGKVAAGQVTATCPVKPPLGVRVIVEMAPPPAAAVAADPPRAKVPNCVTVTVVWGNGGEVVKKGT